MYYYLQLPYFSETQRQVCFTALIKTDRIFFFVFLSILILKMGILGQRKKKPCLQTETVIDLQRMKYILVIFTLNLGDEVA